ncbi:MAG TPA: chemotaxis response regulator protein-glutamate methylesterase [candidate division Zixibacteria bacterium]|nr:chemotaxis response regulator protein-glutamate methylesterase [candidate division Zixibacteria bacterium]
MTVQQGKTRVLVVDDSAFMRKAISMMLESDPDIEVVGAARDGGEGVELVKKLKPDLVTMDVEMPRVDGLTALRMIMQEEPTPVMMVSSLTSNGASATLTALELGAVDFIPKELSFVSLDIVNIKDDLLEKIKSIARRKNILMARARSRARWAQAGGAGAGQTSPAAAGPQSGAAVSGIVASKRRALNVKMIALGCSTGGPPALQTVVERLPRNLPVPMLVVQHMPPKFTKSLADRIDSVSKVTVVEATNGEEALPGQVYIAPGDKHMVLSPRQDKVIIRTTDYPPNTLYKPCVDVMMKSVVERFGKQTLGVILTGMGNDGFAACQQLHGLGGEVIAQSEESCVVYGMPRAVVDGKVASIVQSIERISDEIVSFF